MYVYIQTLSVSIQSYTVKVRLELKPWAYRRMSSGITTQDIYIVFWAYSRLNTNYIASTSCYTTKTPIARSSPSCLCGSHTRCFMISKWLRH